MFVLSMYFSTNFQNDQINMTIVSPIQIFWTGLTAGMYDVFLYFGEGYSLLKKTLTSRDQRFNNDSWAKILNIGRNFDHVNFLTLNFEKKSLIQQKTYYELEIDLYLLNK